jgi:hypothetical protein
MVPDNIEKGMIPNFENLPSFYIIIKKYIIYKNNIGS